MHEALDGLLYAQDEAQLKLAQGQANTSREIAFAKMRNDLTKFLAACEALVDFPDDDLPDTLVAENQHRLEVNLRTGLWYSFLAQNWRKCWMGFRNPPCRSAQCRKKHSLNALAGYERAIVTEIPGTTRDFVELDLKLGPFQVRFVDTAGLRQDAGDAVEQLGIERTWNAAWFCRSYFKLVRSRGIGWI